MGQAKRRGTFEERQAQAKAAERHRLSTLIAVAAGVTLNGRKF
jgi:hypothetical protein